MQLCNDRPLKIMQINVICNFQNQYQLILSKNDQTERKKQLIKYKTQQQYKNNKLMNCCYSDGKSDQNIVISSTLSANHQTLHSSPGEEEFLKNNITSQTEHTIQPIQKSNLRLKFNTSIDNLRCFIASPKPENYQSVSSRLSKQSKSQVALLHLQKRSKSQFSQSNLKLKFNNENLEPNLQNQNYQTESSHSESSSIVSLENSVEQAQIQRKSIIDENDFSKIISDQIIHCIEEKGIKHRWSDIEHIKSEVQNNRDDELEILELFNLFSDQKIVKKYAPQSSHSVLFDASLVLSDEISIIQEMKSQSSYSKGEISENQQLYSSHQKNYSSTSTAQPFSNFYYPVQMYPTNQIEMSYYQMTSQDNSMYQNEQQYYYNNRGSGLRSMPSSMFQSCEFIISPQGLGRDPRTTIMIKNIPNKYTIQFLSEQIDQQFGNFYDFLYLPYDTKSGANQGYGFINFVDLEAIKRFYYRFHGKKWRRFRSQKICNLTYGRLQGITSLIQHFQNSKVLNHKEKKYQPIIKKLNQQISNLIKQQQTAHQLKP